MKKLTYKTTGEFAESLGLTKQVGDLADMKARLTKEIIQILEKKELTHQEVAESSGVPRSAITGIINGSLQKVTLDRLIRILNALGKSIEFKLKDAA